jgi:hypothetical protein
MATDTRCLQLYESIANPYGQAFNRVKERLKPSASDVLKGSTKLDSINESTIKASENRRKEIEKLMNDDGLSKEQKEVYLKQLVRAKALFGPLHEYLFVTAIGEEPVFRRRMNDVGSTRLTQWKLKKYKEMLYSSNPNDIFHRKQIASKMMSELFRIFNDNYYDRTTHWASYSNTTKIEIVEKNMYKLADLSPSTTDLIEMMDAMSSIRNQKYGNKFLEEIFDASMPEVFEIVNVRASSKRIGLVGNLAVGSAAGLATFFLSAAAPDLVQTASTVGIASFGATSLYGFFSSVPSRIRGKIAEKVKTGKTEKKLIESFTEETLAQVANEVKKSEALEDKNDLIFGQIKKELKEGINPELIYLPMWGSGFSDGLANIINRQENIKLRLIEIIKQVTPVEGHSFNNISLDKKRAMEVLMTAARGQMQRLAVDIQALRIDVLALAQSLDTYRKQTVDAHIKETDPDNKGQLKLKISELKNQEIMIESLASGMKNFEITFTSHANQINDLHALIQTNLLLGATTLD